MHIYAVIKCLPIGYISLDGVSSIYKLCNLIMQPLKIDRKTMDKVRSSYITLLIEVDIDQILPDETDL